MKFCRRIFGFIVAGALGAAALAGACKKKGKRNPEACNGNTRREVKLMIDPAASSVDTAAV